MKLFISAGEASGDAYGAAILRQVWRNSNLALQKSDTFALGGHQIAAAGANIICDSSAWGAISIVQALLVAPKVIIGYYRAVNFLKKSANDPSPKLLIPIDFGYMNVRLAREAKRFGWTVLYFVPPGSWRRDQQGQDVAAYSDVIVTPFEWSATLFQQMGHAHVHWFGHPLKNLLADRFRDSSIPIRNENIAILPGSRTHEVEQNLPLISKIVGVHPLEFALNSPETAAIARAVWEQLVPGSPATFTVGETAAVLLRSKAAIVCSGTATLEAALCRCPMMVMYNFSPAMRWEAKVRRLKRPEFIALPNLFLQRRAVPEFVDTEATVETCEAALWHILSEAGRREQLLAFSELDSLLGEDEAIAETSKLAVAILLGEPVATDT